MNKKLDKIFEIVSFYDKCRWEDAGNNNLINFYRDGLADDTKLLTHWLCYITDRQMDFQRIWDVGGFVFSELADKYKNVTSQEALFVLFDSKPNNLDCSFIRKDKKIIKSKSGDKEPYSFVGKTPPNELIMKKYPKNIEKESDEIVVFKSRYLPIDYFVSIR
jgi:hypothetical protein